MAGITFMTTADEQTTARWNSTGTATISNTYARTGTYSFRLGNTGFLQRSVTSSATCPYVRAAVLHSSATGYISIQFREGAINHLNVYLDMASGTVSVRRESNVLATYSAG